MDGGGDVALVIPVFLKHVFLQIKWVVRVGGEMGGLVFEWGGGAGGDGGGVVDPPTPPTS